LSSSGQQSRKEASFFHLLYPFLLESIRTVSSGTSKASFTLPKIRLFGFVTGADSADQNRHRKRTKPLWCGDLDNTVTRSPYRIWFGIWKGFGLDVSQDSRFTLSLAFESNAFTSVKSVDLR
jgi:hypothetical protein